MNKQRLIISAVLLAALVTGCAGNTPRETQVQRLTPEEVAKLTPAAVPTLSLDEVIVLSKQKVTADEIISKIKASNSQYDLTATQIVTLSNQGVDAKVLDFMQTEREKVRLNSMADEINKREKANKAAQEQLKSQQFRGRYDPFYDPFYQPFYGYGFSPYWGSHFYFDNMYRRRR
jgi:PBP1b-binding outer membrane lipoprotein LpoB